jgi:hypothetical protein
LYLKLGFSQLPTTIWRPLESNSPIEAAGLGLSTIVDFEKSRRDVSRTAVHAMQEALEKAGIQFIAKNGGGPGVRLRQ